MAFDPDAFLAGGAPVAEPPAFDPDAFLADGAASGFDPDAFLAESAAPAAEGDFAPRSGSVVDHTKPIPGTVVNMNPGDYIESLQRMSPEVAATMAPLDPVADEALRVREREMGVAPFSLGPEGFQEALSASQPLQAQAPVIALPKPENTGVGSGIARSVIGNIEALETPESLALLSGIGRAPKLIQQAAALGFGTAMVKGAFDQFMDAPEGETSGQKAERITNGVLALLLGAAAGKHGADGRPMRGGLLPGEKRPPSMTQAEVDAKLTAPEARPVAPESTPEAATVIEPPPRFEKSAPSSSGEGGAAVASSARTVSGTRYEPAVKFEDGSIIEGKSHPEILKQNPSLSGPVRGFVDPSGKFHNLLDVVRSEIKARQQVAPFDKLSEPKQPAAEQPTSAETRSQNPELAQAAVEAAPVPVTAKELKLADGAPPELLPKEGESAPPKLDTKRSIFALGISPDNKAVNWLTSNVKRLFTATGDLPKETFEGWIQRNGFVKSESRQVAYATRDLYNGLKKEFGISNVEALTKGFSKVPTAVVDQMNKALLGEADINTLPENLRSPLQSMRDHVDALSQKMLDEGVVPDSLKAKVAENLGVYMTRSYRIFDDPAWAEKIPQDARNRARDFILSNLQKTDPAATPATANAVMKSMLQDWKDQGTGALVKTGGKIGSKDLTSFIERKDIPKVLRDLMGEYHDPTVNYARSVTKMANLIGSQRFLNDVRTQGMGKFLFEDGKQPATHTALIAAEGSDVMAPLNGLRTTPEVATAFREFGKTDPIKNGILRALANLSGVAKSVKTVGSLMTQARNTLGQAYFFAMNGHFDMTQAAPALRAVLADLGARDTPAGREAYQRYLRLGIVDQSARASELRDIINDAGLNSPGAPLTEPGLVLAKTAKKLTVDAAARGYQISDDLGKIIGFENELTRQRAIHPEWSETTREATAAERVRNTYPTYSMVPKAVQNLRRLPVAPFASFAAETFRTAYHNLRYTIEDLHSSNPAQKKAGAQRLAGQLAVAGSGVALSAISQALLGMNTQEEDDARRFMAPWDKDSQIAFTGKGPGEAQFVNMSYVNPYSYLTDPILSVASGMRDADQLDEVMLRSFAKLLQPFTSEDILAGALIDVQRNKTQTGARVFNPGDTPAKRWSDVSGHLLKTLEPGTITRVKSKIIPAIKGETDRSGRKPELSTEVLNELTGFKQQTLDYKQAIGFKAREFKKADDDADSIFREVAARRGTVKPEDVADAYKRATRSKFETWQSFYRDVQAARRRGVSDSEIRTAVEARGVSSAEAGAVMSGKFVPPQVSPSLSRQMQENKRTLPQEATNEMQRARGLVLSGRFE